MRDRTIDADRNDIEALIEAGRKREEASNSKTLDLWSRWIYAVCIGCGYTPRNVRIVYTKPARVLAGIPAAEDDARERSARRRTRTARATRRRVTQAVFDSAWNWSRAA